MNCRICGKKLIHTEIIDCATTDTNSVYNKPCSQDLISMPFYYCDSCHHGQIENIMPEDYYSHYNLLTAGGVNKTGGSSVLREKHYRIVLQKIKNYLPISMQRDSKYLDIGCGTGTIMRHATEYFSIVSGVEPSEDECKIAVENGLTVDNAYFDDVYISRMEGAQYHVDAFTAIGVIEHLTSPIDMVKLIYKILNENGVGYVEVPNGTNIINKGNYTDINSDHLSYFSVESLVKTFMDAGFQIIEASEVCDGAFVVVYVRKTSCRIGFNDRFEKDIDMVTHLYKKHTRVGIYGCGMKGKAFIKAAGNKINDFTPSHIFDANRDMAGCYIPNCLTPVEIPSEHAICECDVIYITAVEFKQEILQYLIQIKYAGQVYIMGNDSV